MTLANEDFEKASNEKTTTLDIVEKGKDKTDAASAKIIRDNKELVANANVMETRGKLIKSGIANSEHRKKHTHDMLESINDLELTIVRTAYSFMSSDDSKAGCDSPDKYSPADEYSDKYTPIQPP
eukprot:8827768-Ditylum_brightwellii.AAC.1